MLKPQQNNTGYLYMPRSNDFAGINAIEKQLKFQFGVHADIKVTVIDAPQEIIEIRDISNGQAKIEILDFIEKSGRAFYSEISRELKLDIELVVNLCEDLERENLVKGAGK